MPQNLTQATVSKLIKGLITEAGELTFPEDATVDELNCVLNRDGSRERRQGLSALPGFVGQAWSSDYFSSFTWENAGGNAGLKFLVLQTGTTLRFIDLSASPLSSGIKSFTVDLTAYGTGQAISQFTTIFGNLVVANSTSSTLYIKYTAVTDSITVSPISFKVRDFEWQSPYSELTSEAALAPSAVRRYDTLNAGWNGSGGSPALSTYLTARAKYPPLTIPWYAGKNSSGAFSVTEFRNIHNVSGTTGNGTFILDFFNKDRTTASGISGLTTEVESNRFTTVAAFAGRVFYSGLGTGKNSGKVLFSQVVDNISADNISELLGKCHQVNDPTAEDFSDLLDTDGGEILIPDAVNIQKLHAFSDYLFVFAENGVWFIKGVDSRFTASSYFVSKVSSVGIVSPSTFVSVDGAPFWWSSASINTVSFGDSGFPIEQNLTISTIQSFMDGITKEIKQDTVAVYDNFNKKIFWWYGDEVGKRNKCIILDIPLQAFYPWEVGGSATEYSIGAFYSEPLSAVTVTTNVTVSTGNVTVSGGNVILQEVQSTSDADTRLVVVFKSGSSVFFGQFSDKTFKDFTDNDYESFFESGYFFGGDLLLKKTSPYVTVYLRSTEEGFTGNSTIGYTPINPSGLTVKSYWDFKTDHSSSQQAYRLKPFILVDASDLTKTNQKSSVITTRLKMRGRGRSMRLRFEADPGKNFAFLGYSILVGINDKF